MAQSGTCSGFLLRCLAKGGKLISSVQKNLTPPFHHWVELNGPPYTVTVAGHLYCHSSPTFDLEYNAQSLLSHLVREKDPLALSNIIAGGIYTLFVFDEVNQMLYVQGDRFGFKPLYYRKKRDQIEFSDNQLLLGSKARLKATSIDEFLSFGYLPYSDSLFEDVSQLLAGETLILKADAELSVAMKKKLFHLYPEPEKRVQDLREAVERIEEALKGYYKKLTQDQYCLGLSGGYDSRLIAAFLTPYNPFLINFGNPRSLEVQMAEQVSRRLGLPLHQFEIPSNALKRAADIWPRLMKIPCDLSYSHIAELVKSVEEHGTKYYVDGFLGDTVIGGRYYFKLAESPLSLVKNLLFLNAFSTPILPIENYCNASLLPALSKEGKETLIANRKRHVLAQRERCFTHEDMQEALLFTTRGRRLIAGGPIAIMSQTVCLCPYVDYSLYDAAMSIEKGLRGGNLLYNALWNKMFPELSDIPKNDTGAAPSSNKNLYRIRHGLQAMKRRALYPLIKFFSAGLLDYREEYSSIGAFLREPSNKEFVDMDLHHTIFLVEDLLRIGNEDLKKKLAQSEQLKIRILTLEKFLSTSLN